MSKPLFARAYPSSIKITETYQYHANMTGNPMVEEKGRPEGQVLIAMPFDGHKFFTRRAYADVLNQYQERSGDQSANIGYLAFTNLQSEDFWVEEVHPPSRMVLPIQIPIPSEREGLPTLIEDRKMAILKHHYAPKWPDVFPRPRPLRLGVNVYDEHTMQDLFGDTLLMSEWERIAQELSFDRSLFIGFSLELAVPKGITVSELPIVRLLQLQWPVATSYHMLTLNIEPENEQKGSEWPERDIYYIPERGCVEWRDVQFRSSNTPADSNAPDGSPQIYYAPIMILKVHEPGEFYQQSRLLCNLEVELPGMLLSSASATYFNALGNLDTTPTVTTSSRVLADIEISLKERFDRKVLSPHQHIQFEGVELGESRMNDIATLLKDLGFKVDPHKDLVTYLEPPKRAEFERLNIRMYAITARKTEGADEMRVWIFARGTISETERETIIPGGKSYKTFVTSGNTELDMHAEMRGDVRKLDRVMNTIHNSLKERFRYIITNQ